MNDLMSIIEKVVEGRSLSVEESTHAFQIIMNGEATPAQIAALLVSLRIKGETVSEITGAAITMREKSLKIKAPRGTLDTCGTGGDGLNTLNISTAVAFILAGCDIPVAKHGNRAISSKSGSADVLKELGINIEAEIPLLEQSLQGANICFMMAPQFHTAMRHVAPVRKELGIRTLFNLLGPLTNPATSEYQLIGVYDKALIEPIAQVLQQLGTKRAWVVAGSDGMDELTITGPSYVAQLIGDEITSFTVSPEDAGLKIESLQEIIGGNAAHNAKELRNLLLNHGNPVYKHIVLLNAAAALIVADKTDNLKEGVEMAHAALEEGKANDAFLALVNITNQT